MSVTTTFDTKTSFLTGNVLRPKPCFLGQVSDNVCFSELTLLQNAFGIIHRGSSIYRVLYVTWVCWSGLFIV